MTELWLIRHGQTECNVNQTHQVYQTPLSAHGHEQARRLAERLGRERADALYSSDLTRALQTAEAIARVTGLPIRTDPRLREHDLGIFKGLTAQEAMARDPQAYARWRSYDLDAECPGGESPRAVMARMHAALQEIAHAHAGQRVVIVSHGRAIRCAALAIFHLPDSLYGRLATPNTGINIIRYADGQPHLVAWGDTHHLQTPSA